MTRLFETFENWQLYLTTWMARRLVQLRKMASSLAHLQEMQLQELGGPRKLSRLCTPVELLERQIRSIRSQADELVLLMQTAQRSSSSVAAAAATPPSPCSQGRLPACDGMRVKALVAIEAAHWLSDLADSVEEVWRKGGPATWRLQARAALRFGADLSTFYAAARCGSFALELGAEIRA
jgi:hypothetical protein